MMFCFLPTYEFFLFFVLALSYLHKSLFWLFGLGFFLFVRAVTNQYLALEHLHHSPLLFHGVYLGSVFSFNITFLKHKVSMTLCGAKINWKFFYIQCYWRVEKLKNLMKQTQMNHFRNMGKIIWRGCLEVIWA